MRLLIALCLLPAIAAGAQAAEVKGTSRIDAVTVYPSGAEVVRIGKVRIEGGEHTLLFADLPANAIASSVRVEGKASGRLEIGSVDTRSVSVPRADDAVAASERRRVEDAIEKLKDDRSVLQASVVAAEAQKRLIDNLTQLPTRPAPAHEAASAQPDWGQLFGLIGERAAQAQKAILDAQIRIRDVERQIKDLEGKLASLAPTQQARIEVKVFVHAGSPLEADIVIRYQVRSASWTPFYDARLTTGTKAQAPKLKLVRRASIQQRTGEVWDNVALALSTARPAAGTASPVLSPVVVDYEPDTPPPPSPRPAPQATPRGHVGSGRLDAERAERTTAADGLVAEEQRARVEVQAFQAIYAIAGRVTVPDTGEIKRVQIDDVELDPALGARTVPKREEKAYLYARMTVARGTPLLPGQVSLFRDTTFVGNGRLPLLAPGEEHELGFGVDDAIRVRYAVAEEKRGETGLITTSKTDARSYRITVKNLHERAMPLVVQDQIPVSQNADIKVELTGRSAPTKRDVDDKRGILAWEATLAPDEERVIEFGYRATWPAAKKVTYGQGS
ncbi:MAG: mucoidy inhibitor MuiA family protein [Hyphomonadaceae bacterium]|nr:mucoidy inhibitor MuiA family protein [Hyphomonadaceae bacterium]